jgi:multiple sugar transport system substrate-binding protein
VTKNRRRRRGFYALFLIAVLLVSSWTAPTARMAGKYSGTTLHVLMYGATFTSSLESLMINQFGKQTGATIKIEVAPYNDMHEKELLDLSSGTSNYDVMTMDNPWLPEMVATGNVFDLTQSFNRAPASFRNGFIPGILNAYGMQNGKLWALPFQPGAQMMFYRKDLFAKYATQFKAQTGHDLKPPTNWDDFLRVSKFFTKKYNPSSPTEYGNALAAQKGNAAVNEYAQILWSLGGNEFNCKWQATTNTPTGLKALQIMQGMVTYAQPDATTAYWDEESRTFESGSAAMMLQWDSFAGDLINPKVSKVTVANGNVGFAPLPGGVSSLGGWAMIVNKNAKNTAVALALAEWIAGPDIAVQFTMDGGLAARSFVFNTPALVKRFPWLPIDLKSYQNVRRRTSPQKNGPTIIPEASYETIEGTALNAALSGQMSPQAALQQTDSQLNKLVAPLVSKFGSCSA